MVYHWDGKQDEVYQLYVVERKSLDELVKHMKEKYQFEPRYGSPLQATLTSIWPALTIDFSRRSKRAYQTQFKVN